MKKFIVFAVLIITSCTTITQNNGAEIRQIKLDQVTPASSKTDIFTLLGSPSTKSVYGQETWYYITSQIKRQLVKDDKIINESVVAISFTKEDKVDKVKIYDTAAHREFATSDRVTPTAGKKLGAVEQILGNVGKFNTDSPNDGATIGSHAPGGGVGGY